MNCQERSGILSSKSNPDSPFNMISRKTRSIGCCCSVFTASFTDEAIRTQEMQGKYFFSINKIIADDSSSSSTINTRSIRVFYAAKVEAGHQFPVIGL